MSLGLKINIETNMEWLELFLQKAGSLIVELQRTI